MRSVLEKAGELLLEDIRRDFRENNLSASGDSLNSLNIKILDTGSGYKLQLWGLDYIYWLIYGRRPGTFPHIDPIKKWVEQKLNVEESQVDSVAYLIGRKIMEKGTEILNDRSKGVQIELAIMEVNLYLKKAVAKEYSIQVTNELKKKWR